MKSVIVVIGAGQIGQAIARRISVGKNVVLADMRPENAQAAADALASRQAFAIPRVRIGIYCPEQRGEKSSLVNMRHRAEG